LRGRNGHTGQNSEATVSWRVFAAKRKLKRLLTTDHAAPSWPLAGQETRAENGADHVP